MNYKKVLKDLENYIIDHPEVMKNPVSINIHLLDSNSYTTACDIRKKYNIYRRQHIDKVAIFIFYCKYRNSSIYIEDDIGNKINFRNLLKSGHNNREDWHTFYDFVTGKKS